MLNITISSPITSEIANVKYPIYRSACSKIFPDTLIRLQSTIITRVEIHRIDCTPREVQRGCKLGKVRTRVLTRDVSRFVDAALSFAILQAEASISGTAIPRARHRLTAMFLICACSHRARWAGRRSRGGTVRIPSRFSQLTYRFLAGCPA